ncbi:helix-turn-helix transcriptional regulator [Agitococcus lubricus]|uniref:Helix-turn-helix protein n=1 Tax=Agitococcus lubricus TaxID=1077255 RepID=A0A2T5J431_9GAMM|nr:helix-turn-helix transcriptional regulator [Agitococcus lubricus]PTQ91253.1 helix-turn-helix protein [Agitococcus lubricus]
MDKNVFSRLKEERERCGVTQAQVADLTEVNIKSVGRWEREIPIPSDKLAMLSTLGIDVLYVLIGQRSIPVVLNAKEEALLDNYRNSNEAGKKAVETTASAFANADTDKKAANGS